jgi:hypothetical protein
MPKCSASSRPDGNPECVSRLWGRQSQRCCAISGQTDIFQTYALHTFSQFDFSTTRGTSAGRSLIMVCPASRAIRKPSRSTRSLPGSPAGCQYYSLTFIVTVFSFNAGSPPDSILIDSTRHSVLQPDLSGLQVAL